MRDYRGTICTTAILLAVVSNGCNNREPAAEPLSAAELVAEVESIQPGKPFAVGVLITLKKGWHTYWKDPGDSGMAPIFEWHLPEGFEAGPVLWPEPKRLETPPLVNYVYEERVLLMTEITPPADLTARGRVTIECGFSWLICKEVCVARDAQLDLVLPVSAGVPQPSAAWHELFQQTRQQI